MDISTIKSYLGDSPNPSNVDPRMVNLRLQKIETTANEHRVIFTNEQGTTIMTFSERASEHYFYIYNDWWDSEIVCIETFGDRVRLWFNDQYPSGFTSNSDATVKVEFMEEEANV